MPSTKCRRCRLLRKLRTTTSSAPSKPTVPSTLPRRFSLSKAPLRVPTSPGQNFLIGYFLRGIHEVTQTSTRRVQVVWFLDFRSSYDFSFSPSKNRLIGRHYLMCEARVIPIP